MLHSTVPYLASLHVDLVYMGPFFSSPKESMDQYYEVLDHRTIDPRFGTLQDFLSLKEAFHSCNIRLLIDFPICTLSVHSLPFKASADVTHPLHHEYRDWFIWHDLNADGSPINNWKGFTRETVWRFHKKRQQTYLAWFYPSQANLNLREEKVQRYLLDALNFWLAIAGVDGMRVDAVARLFNHKISQENPFNYSPLPNTSEEDLPWDRFDNREVAHLPETFEFLANIQRQYPNQILLPEIAAGGDDFEAGRRCLDAGLKYVYTAEGFESHSLNSNDFNHLAHIIRDQFASQHVLSIGGHDNCRLFERTAPKDADRIRFHLYALATGLALPGPFLNYQGYELGWRDSLEYLETITKNEKFSVVQLDPLRRDGSRTPFVYDNEWEGTGWEYLPPDPEHLAEAVSIQERVQDSCLQKVRTLFRFVKSISSLLTSGTFDILNYPNNPDVIAWLRKCDNREVLFVSNGTSRQLTHRIDFSLLISNPVSLLHGSSEIAEFGHAQEIQLLPHGYGFFLVEFKSESHSEEYLNPAVSRAPCALNRGSPSGL